MTRSGARMFDPYAHVAPGSVHVLQYEARRDRWVCLVCGNLFKSPAQLVETGVDNLPIMCLPEC